MRPDDEHPVAPLQSRGIAQAHGSRRERPSRPDEPEAGVVIVGDHFGGDDGPGGVADAGRHRLQHDVADGQHEAAVVDDHAVGLPPGSEKPRRARVGGDFRLDAHKGAEHLLDRGALRRDGRRGDRDRDRQRRPDHHSPPIRRSTGLSGSALHSASEPS